MSRNHELDDDFGGYMDVNEQMTVSKPPPKLRKCPGIPNVPFV